MRAGRMQIHLHNTTNQSRLCIALQETLEPFEVREISWQQYALVNDCHNATGGCRCMAVSEDRVEGRARRKRPSGEIPKADE